LTHRDKIVRRRKMRRRRRGRRGRWRTVQTLSKLSGIFRPTKLNDHIFECM
jgi:hypothetical protein